MFWLSLLLAPSVPRATGTPARSIAGTGATPAPSFRLLTGLCTTPASDAARTPISLSWTSFAHTFWLVGRGIGVLAASDAGVVPTPVSNLKLGAGEDPDLSVVKPDRVRERRPR